MVRASTRDGAREHAQAAHANGAERSGEQARAEHAANVDEAREKGYKLRRESR
jgi:hypothetical protein